MTTLFFYDNLSQMVSKIGKNGNTTESELLRTNVWKQENVSKFWVYNKNRSYKLAQINPIELSSLRKGFVNSNAAEKRSSRKC